MRSESHYEAGERFTSKFQKQIIWHELLMQA